MDIGHSWDPKKKTSGTVVTQPITKANGIFVCFEDCERFREFGTSSIQRNESVGQWYIEENE